MQPNFLRLALAFLAGSVALGGHHVLQATEADVTSFDWPQWRGPQQDRTSSETGLIDRWNPSGGRESNLLWKNSALRGRSTPIVMGGRLYAIVRADPGTPKEGEKVVCADAATGEILWENRFNVCLSDVPAERVGWSCCVGDPKTRRIYALGVCGYFQCLDGETGETIWSHPLHEEQGLLSTYGGRTNIPVLFENLVIISAVVIGWGETSKPAHRLMAFDQITGDLVWFRGTRLLPYDTTYSTPTIAHLNGQMTMVFGSGDGAVWAFQPRTGNPIWQYPFSRRGLFGSPLVVENVVYMGHSEENISGNRMGGLVAIEEAFVGNQKIQERWRLEEVMIGKSSPILVGDRLYGIDNGAKLLAFNALTGEPLFSKSLGGNMFSTPLYADGKLYVCTENRYWYILKPTRDGVDVLSRSRMPRGEQCYGSPIVSRGRIYVPTTGHLYCFGKKDYTPTVVPVSATVNQRLPVRDDQPAHVQTVPCEVLLNAGEKQPFTVKVFNEQGQLLQHRNVRFSVEGGGSISEEGIYTAPAVEQPTVASVQAKVGGLEGQAKIRLVPELPCKFTFDNGQVPLPWIGARYRHIILDMDLLQSLQTENPLAYALYIHFMTGFVNYNTDTLHFDDHSPRRLWTQLVRYLRTQDISLEEHNSFKTLEKAQHILRPALVLLKKVGVLDHWTWSSQGPRDFQLQVERGSRRLEGNGVMAKVTTIPKGTRSRCWLGHPEWNNYTIEADVRGSLVRGNLPDMGLIAQGYTLDLMGASQQLQIRSWAPQLDRFSTTVPFSWKHDTWYRLKFCAAIEDGQAVLKGKAWPRDQEEPDAWTCQAIDEAPCTQGSPGLFGNATNAEIFYDNIAVTPNRMSDKPRQLEKILP